MTPVISAGSAFQVSYSFRLLGVMCILLLNSGIELMLTLSLSTYVVNIVDTLCSTG